MSCKTLHSSTVQSATVSATKAHKAKKPGFHTSTSSPEMTSYILMSPSRPPMHRYGASVVLF